MTTLGKSNHEKRGIIVKCLMMSLVNMSRLFVLPWVSCGRSMQLCEIGSFRRFHWNLQLVLWLVSGGYFVWVTGNLPLGKAGKDFTINKDACLVPLPKQVESGGECPVGSLESV